MKKIISPELTIFFGCGFEALGADLFSLAGDFLGLKINQSQHSMLGKISFISC